MSQIDGIAYTRGPGMPGCLNVCSGTARAIAAALDKPCVGVHHMVSSKWAEVPKVLNQPQQGHALTPTLTIDPSDPTYPKFPFLTLLVSGGHTLLLLATSPTSFRTLATTADLSIGRAYDKVTKLLQLPWTRDGPGATLEAFVNMCASSNYSMKEAPRPQPVMPGRLTFSYAGLVSYVERFLHARGGIDTISQAEKLMIAKGFQVAASAQLEEKISLALRWCANQSIKVEHVVVSGGVARNVYLLER
jgi:N6-L-threonylcarbamoyladenine synthase